MRPHQERPRHETRRARGHALPAHPVLPAARRPAPGVTVTRKQPQPEPPPDNGHAKAGQRPHREPGAAVTGHHADRPGDPRSGPNQAGLAWAAGGGHDYTHRGPPPLPAWFYVLQGQPVPDDAPRTPPPTGFAELMAKRRGARPDGDSDQAAAAGQPGAGQADRDDAIAPGPADQGSSGIGNPPVGA